MTTILVAPVTGRRVVTPQGVLVPAKFLVDPRDPYWARALRDGDIEEVKTSKADPAPAPAAVPDVTPATSKSGSAAK